MNENLKVRSSVECFRCSCSCCSCCDWSSCCSWCSFRRCSSCCGCLNLGMCCHVVEFPPTSTFTVVVTPLSTFFVVTSSSTSADCIFSLEISFFVLFFTLELCKHSLLVTWLDMLRWRRWSSVELMVVRKVACLFITALCRDEILFVLEKVAPLISVVSDIVPHENKKCKNLI